MGWWPSVYIDGKAISKQVSKMSIGYTICQLVHTFTPRYFSTYGRQIWYPSQQELSLRENQQFTRWNPSVKEKLVQYYRCNLYGGVLWDLSQPDIEDICTAWRRGLRRVWGLQYRTHSALLYRISNMLPLKWLVAATPSIWNFGSNWLRWSEIANFGSIFTRIFPLCGLRGPHTNTFWAGPQRF